MPDLEDRSRRYLAQWDCRSNLRARARSLPQAGFAADGLMSPQLVPGWDHPLVAGLGAEGRRFLTLQRCYDILREIARGEAEVVGAACIRLAGREGEGLLPAAARQALLTIAVDEGYHAFAAREAIERMAEITALPAEPEARDSPMAAGLEEALAAVPAAARPALTLLVVVLVENSVTDELVGMIAGSDRQSPFHRLNLEHLQDEARHRAFFRTLLTELWPGLEPAQRRCLAAALPLFLARYLDGVAEAGLRRCRGHLAAAGLTPAEAETVAAPQETLCRCRAQQPFWLNMRRCLEATGLLRDPDLQDGLAAGGWLDPPARAVA